MIFLWLWQVHGDLEKDDEDDYSGSGYGDDDEDTRHSINRNTQFNKGHTTDLDHNSNKDISGSGDGSTYHDLEDNEDDNSEDLWTDTSKPELPSQPEKPHIQEEHSQFAWLFYFIISSSTYHFFWTIFFSNLDFMIKFIHLISSFI